MIEEIKVKINGTVYEIEEILGGVYCSTEKVQGQSRQLMVFRIKDETWTSTMLLQIPNENLIVLEKIIRAVLM